ncbi:hypothetical protein K9N68_25875 [Kovacikia minuta CCNUW1]|uniref:DUF6745 domain-containing protein n=1 Tax=Kovacikia minuta TaxID=2931930 RepID=UPI001CCC6167|nr:hypothetical protein [Kovacikia minuta]UBF25037.1 hypothetical protein K9N68_25875 [Kovacikia minuta CCNUW1]
MAQIETLTPEQETLIPIYREKWRKIALSTEPIDQGEVAAVIGRLYSIIAETEPEILFFDSPFTTISKLEASKRWNPIKDRLNQQRALLRTQIIEQLSDDLWVWIAENLIEHERLRLHPNQQIHDQIYWQLYSQLGKLPWQSVNRFLNNHLTPNASLSDSAFCDFCISELACSYAAEKWELEQLLLEKCYWIFPFQGTCLVCDRPRILQLDSENRLHAEGEPAIQFADGYRLYACHGVTLPEKYGNVYPHQWQAKWLLEETNAELRRVLIQGIGYARICQELQANELDNWQDYTLLKIDAEADVEPIVLLKMTCPSTNYIHVLRVPPDLQSAREAIAWINWGIDPEEFSSQT